VAPIPAPPDLSRLKQVVDEAVRASRLPPKPGMTSWPFRFPQQHLSRQDFQLLVQVLRFVQEHHRRVFNVYLHERTILDLVFDFVAESSSPPTIAGIVRELKTRARAESSWLVEVSLSNLLPPRNVVSLSPKAVLVKADGLRDRDRRDRDQLEEAETYFAVRKQLNDHLGVRARWLFTSQQPEGDIDTRFTAGLLLVEEGTEEVAMSLALTRARFAVAMWCLSMRPERTKRSRPIWPTVSMWAPAPHMLFGTVHKAYKPHPLGSGHAPTRGASVTHFEPYRLRDNPTLLQAPFTAMDEARQGNDAAIALLSAARSLYLAAMFPSDLERTERVMHLWAAREALCAQGHRGAGRSDARWDRLVQNLRLREYLSQPGYRKREVDNALKLMEALRDLSTHLADDVLVNLDFPAGRKVQLHKSRLLDSSSLSLAMVVHAYPVLYALVNTAARRLAKRALQNRWDEAAFHSCFA
jgi:hypothetical protein